MLRSAEATKPVDYTQRNATFTPAAPVTPENQELPRDNAVQDKRVEKSTIVKPPAALGDRRAAIAVQEARDKSVREKASTQPAPVEEPKSAFDHREAAISTATDIRKPPLVTKYQASLAAASASNMARFPALARTTTAKINRFVFLKNSPEPTPVTSGAAVTPAGGSNPVQK